MSRPRADPLPPDDRRLLIVQAVTPLLVRFGTKTTTRQMAEAAGVAEGTIFRVFADKRALIHHCVEHALNPEPVQRRLGALDPNTPLRQIVIAAANVLLERFDEVIALMNVVRTMPHSEPPRAPGSLSFVVESSEAVMASLTALFERYRSQLRVDPARAASAFRALVFARAHPVMMGGEKLTTEEIADVLLSGVASNGREGDN